MNKITLGIGESQNISISGSRFYYEKGLGKILVKTKGNDSNAFELWPGMGFKNRDGQMNFPSLEIYNLHTAEQDIEFSVSYREIFDNRVSFDNVKVESNEREVTQSEVAFSQACVLSAPSDDKAAGCALLATGNKKVFVSKITVFDSGSQSPFFISLINWVTFSDDPDIAGVSTDLHVGNKKKGGVAPDSMLQRFRWLAGMPLSYGEVVHVGFGTLRTNVVIEFNPPLLLVDNGDAVMINKAEADRAFTVNFEYIEIDK
jgi:hypothetical protein